MLATKPIRPRGREPNYVNDRDGKPIVGLSRNPETAIRKKLLKKTGKVKTYRVQDGRYYATGSSPRVYFGPDFDIAVMRFRAWQDRERGSKIDFQWVKPLSPESAKKSAELLRCFPKLRAKADHIEKTKTLIIDDYLPEDVFWAKVSGYLGNAAGRRLMAQRTGYKEIEWLFELTPPPVSMSLEEIGNRYAGKKPPISQDEVKQSKKFWKQFLNTVGVRGIEDLKQEHIQSYCDQIYALHEKGKLANSYVTRRFTKIKTIFGWFDKINLNPQHSKRIMSLLTILIPPSKAKGLPKPISRTDFDTLLRAATTEEKSMLLLGLNCGFLPVDIRYLTKSNGLSLDRGIYAGYRHKTKIPQCSMLWKRTIKQVRLHLAENPNSTDYVFVSERGQRFSAEGMRRKFQALRDRAGVPKSVTFDQLRDGAASHSGAVEQKQVDVLIGHGSPGLTDSYVLRHPEIVAKACQNVEIHYFKRPRQQT